jgi:hypothetical protein
MKDADDFTRDSCSFEFLSAPFIVVVRQGVLEVYQIRLETPGAPPVHTISFCMPRLSLDEYRSTAWIFGKSRLSHGVDRSRFFPSPSFQWGLDSSYLTIEWCVSGPSDSDMGPGLTARFDVPLSSLRRYPMDGDASAIPWEVWSKDVYFRQGRMHYEMIGGRLIHFRYPFMTDSPCRVSLFDLNRPRARGPGVISADPWKDYAPPHAIRSNRLTDPGEIRMGRPPPVPLVSRNVSLDGSFLPPRVICDDEHIIFWVVCYMFVPRC